MKVSINRAIYVPLLVVMLAGIAACGQGGVEATNSTEGTPNPAHAEQAEPTVDGAASTDEIESATTPETTPPTLDVAVAAATDDLAATLGIDRSQITVDVAERVTWPDGSLGCPEPGVMYTQALVDGTRIVLKAKGAAYSYHGVEGGVPLVCAAPILPPPRD